MGTGAGCGTTGSGEAAAGILASAVSAGGAGTGEAAGTGGATGSSVASGAGVATRSKVAMGPGVAIGSGVAIGASGATEGALVGLADAATATEAAGASSEEVGRSDMIGLDMSGAAVPPPAGAIASRTASAFGRESGCASLTPSGVDGSTSTWAPLAGGWAGGRVSVSCSTGGGATGSGIGAGATRRPVMGTISVSSFAGVTTASSASIVAVSSCRHVDSRLPKPVASGAPAGPCGALDLAGAMTDGRARADIVPGGWSQRRW